VLSPVDVTDATVLELLDQVTFLFAALLGDTVAVNELLAPLTIVSGFGEIVTLVGSIGVGVGEAVGVGDGIT